MAPAIRTRSRRLPARLAAAATVLVALFGAAWAALHAPAQALQCEAPATPPDEVPLHDTPDRAWALASPAPR